jgi:hypothetical protein
MREVPEVDRYINRSYNYNEIENQPISPDPAIVGQAEQRKEDDAMAKTMTPAVSKMFSRRVRVDRSKTQQQALDATGRRQFCYAAVEVMPRGKGEEEEVDVYFFDLDYDPTVKELDSEYELHCLNADPIAQAKVNADDPAFADYRPNGCQWGLEGGVASFYAFGLWGGKRSVLVDRYDGSWNRIYRFGGVRK